MWLIAEYVATESIVVLLFPVDVQPSPGDLQAVSGEQGEDGEGKEGVVGDGKEGDAIGNLQSESRCDFVACHVMYHCCVLFGRSQL